VQDPVDAPVAGAGEPVTLPVAGGGVQWGGAVPGGDVPAAGEARDVGDVAEQPGRAGRADAVQLLQAAARGRDQLGQLPVGGLDLLVDDREFGDQLGGGRRPG
jgi:hypothetical protein